MELHGLFRSTEIGLSAVPPAIIMACALMQGQDNLIYVGKTMRIDPRFLNRELANMCLSGSNHAQTPPHNYSFRHARQVTVWLHQGAFQIGLLAIFPNQQLPQHPSDILQKSQPLRHYSTNNIHDGLDRQTARADGAPYRLPNTIHLPNPLRPLLPLH